MSFRLAGFRAVRVTSFWRPGLTSPSDDELRILRNVGDAATRNGVRVYVTVMSPGSATTPLTAAARGDFASYAAALVRDVPSIDHVLVGNEPNLNRFWLPQFALDGTSAAPAAYLELLARTYDALKAVSADIRVYGGALSPRGSDRPGGARPTHSPTKFVTELGHRLSGQRTISARHGRVRDSSLRRQLEPGAGHGAPDDHHDRDRRLRQARRRSSARRSTARHRRARSCRSSTVSSASSRRSPRRRRRSTRAPSPP